jgi:hypothetical protein
MLTRRSLVVGLTLVVAVMSVGCASTNPSSSPSSSPSNKARVGSARTCRAHGGTYNATTKSCTYTATTRSAKDTCAASGGYYDVAADVCEIGLE